MLSFDELREVIKGFARNDYPADVNATPAIVVIPATDLVHICKHLHSGTATYFDMLSCITAIDNGPQAGTMELVYNLYSIPFNHHIGLRVVVARENPVVDTVSGIWKTADWHEREAYDMFGIRFQGHPDLRRILMPADWAGYPLRKDYKHEEYYRSIKIEY
jgi:NADH-quinone oxidoreductase subunit C